MNTYYTFFLLSPFLASLSLQVAAQCKDGDLRLMEGRVEFCSSKEWGNVCGNEWDDNDATVVCRELGLSDKDSKAIHGEGAREIVLNGVQCEGTEKKLKDCRTSPEPCGSTAAVASVRCKYACKDGNVVLKPGMREISQICYNRSYYCVIETENQMQLDQGCQNFQSDSQNGNNNSAAAILGALFGISIVAIVVIILVFVIILLYLHNHGQLQLNQHMSKKSNHDDLQNVEREVNNEIYGLDDKDEGEDAITNSMEYNHTYHSIDNGGLSNEAQNHYEHCETDSGPRNIYNIPDSA